MHDWSVAVWQRKMDIAGQLSFIGYINIYRDAHAGKKRTANIGDGTRKNHPLFMVECYMDTVESVGQIELLDGAAIFSRPVALQTADKKKGRI